MEQVESQLARGLQDGSQLSCQWPPPFLYHPSLAAPLNFSSSDTHPVAFFLALLTL